MNAATYHKQTSYNRYNMSPHSLDWGNVPALYKNYPPLPSVALQPATSFPDISLERVFGKTNPDGRQTTLSFEHLSMALALAYGITAQRQYGAQTHCYRSAPSAGALYPCEVYAAVDSMAGLPDGLYNYHIKKSCLVQLRPGTCLQQIGDALAAAADGRPKVSLLISGIFFRSAWKYRERAFRYLLLDAGHLLENLVLSLRMLGYSFSVSYDFEDDAMGHILGIDGKREVCLAGINLYDRDGLNQGKSSGVPTKIPVLPKEIADASRVSNAEIPYGAMQQIYESGKTTKSGLAPDRDSCRVFENMPAEWYPVRSSGSTGKKRGFAETVIERRSRRNFVPYPFQTVQALQLMASLSVPRNPAADEGDQYDRCMTTGFAAVNIEGFDPGEYLLDRDGRRYGQVPGSELTGKQVARVCLGQEWLKNSAVHFTFVANLSDIDRYHGARGYRYAMLNAGRAGQRVYLAAAAQDLGACGIGALYDDEAKEMLGLNRDSALLYLVAVGITNSTFRIQSASKA